MTKIKICCIQNIPETRLAMDAGADILGLVSAMPSGPGPIDDDTIVEIAAFCKGKIETFLLTCETNPEKIITQHNKFRTDSIQLVDSISESTYRQLRKSLPNTKLVQVIHVKDQT
nr:phosphoribosylanthranilate isomerase [Bacteroidota bacterium]